MRNMRNMHNMHAIYVLQDASRKVNRSEVIAMDEAGEIVRNFTNPIYKDTIMLPNGGWVVTKFIADNPGMFRGKCFYPWDCSFFLTGLYKLRTNENKFFIIFLYICVSWVASL